ncbi:M56 family metallopeptidase [Roseimaritima ulvae]|uniref:Regulatory protein BlaR1 n=1 Tax=Roseimaritima ulvae TaxID=980254 RepID=A0A5B9QJN3_9BACT|nr:M56 family metallopeptidase [Roseimaritima ulvae]QEG38179.1 Regulatory protein BlaR1 [Roseimaritima ulvae]
MSHFTMDWSELSLQVMLTFAHFLWQACVIAIALAIGEQISNIVSGRARALRSHQPTPDRSCESANVRYLVACLAFFALPACVAATFTWVHQSRGPILLAESAAVESPALVVASTDERVEPSVSTDIPILPSMEMAAGAELPVAEASEPSVRAQSWTHRMQAYTPYLLIAYAIGATFMLARFGVSILGSTQLCRTVQPIVDSNLLTIIAEQAARLGLKRVPMVALCQRVSVPVVVGIVKPMILLPPSLVCGLDPNQLAAILSHEMAHIRRYDLLINLLQRVVEALLFFHPVTWWISRRVRIERENCCDDMAVTGCGRIEYAAALLRMAEQCAAFRGLKIAPQLDSLAADGDNASQLGNRIRRLLGEDASPRISLTRVSLATIALAVVIGGLSMVAFAQSDDDSWGDASHGLVCRILPVSPSMDPESVDMNAAVDHFSSPDDITFSVELKNVSHQAIHLKDIRYGNDYAEAIRGKLNTNHYAPHLFEFTFTDAAGKAVARTQREFTLDSHAMILRGAYVAKLDPNQSLKFLLKPAKFERSMDHRLPPGDYRVQVSYRGPSPAAKEWIAKHNPGQQLDKLWPHQVTSNVAKFSISAEGFRKPDLVWGPKTDGLQAALEIRVPRKSGVPTRAPGVLPETSLHAVLHVKNVSDKPITFVSETGRQGDRLQIKTAAGEDVKVKDVWMSGWPIDVRWTLQPGDVAELDVLTPSLNQGLTAGEYSARYTIRFNSRQLKDKDGNQIFPAPGDYDSEIDTGWTPLFIRSNDQASADNEVETFVYETLQKPYRPEHNGSTWQAGAHRSMIWMTLASIPQQDLVADALMKKIESSVGSVDLQSRQLALEYCAKNFPDRLLPYLIRHLSTANFPAPDLQISGEGRLIYGEIHAIGEIGEQAKATIPALTKHLSAADPIAREATIRALVRVGPSDPEVLQSLTACFNDDNQRVQSTAVYEAGRYGKLAKPLGPKFAELLDAESKEVQYWAAAALITSEFDPDLGFRKLLEGACTGSTADRSQALTALAMLGTRSVSVLPKLRAMVDDPDVDVARAVRKAIRRIETKTKTKVEGRVIDANGKPIAGASISCLAYSGDEANGFDPVYAETDRDGYFMADVPSRIFRVHVGSPNEIYDSVRGFGMRNGRAVCPWDSVEDQSTENRVFVVATLPRRYALTFELVDADSGQPIRDAAVLYKEDESTWFGDGESDYETSAFWETFYVSQNGETTFQASTSSVLGLAYFRAVATGYEPAEWKLNEKLERGKPLTKTIRMQPVAPIQLTVLQPNGTPAAGATFKSRDPKDFPFTMRHAGGDKLRGLLAIEAKSNGQGVAEFPRPAFGDWASYRIEHATGHTDFKISDLPPERDGAAVVTHRLQLLGHVTVQGRYLPKVLDNEFLEVYHLLPNRKSVDGSAQRVKLDDEGRFTLAPRLAGWHSFVHRIQTTDAEGNRGTSAIASYGPFDLKPGESRRLTLGDEGSSVVGRLSIPEPSSADFGSLTIQAYAGGPFQYPHAPRGLNDHEELAWWDAYWESDAGHHFREYRRRNITVPVAPDGSFHFPMLPPGDYKLRLFGSSSDRTRRKLIPSQLSIPEAAVGSVVDVGSLKVSEEKSDASPTAHDHDHSLNKTSDLEHERSS